jgi:hypothetical protein
MRKDRISKWKGSFAIPHFTVVLAWVGFGFYETENCWGTVNIFAKSC